MTPLQLREDSENIRRIRSAAGRSPLTNALMAFLSLSTADRREMCSLFNAMERHRGSDAEALNYRGPEVRR